MSFCETKKKINPNPPRSPYITLQYMAMTTARTRYENGYVQYLWAGEVAHYCTYCSYDSSRRSSNHLLACRKSLYVQQVSRVQYSSTSFLLASSQLKSKPRKTLEPTHPQVLSSGPPVGKAPRSFLSQWLGGAAAATTHKNSTHTTHRGLLRLPRRDIHGRSSRESRCRRCVEGMGSWNCGSAERDLRSPR